MQRRTLQGFFVVHVLVDSEALFCKKSGLFHGGTETNPCAPGGQMNQRGNGDFVEQRGAKTNSRKRVPPRKEQDVLMND